MKEISIKRKQEVMGMLNTRIKEKKGDVNQAIISLIKEKKATEEEILAAIQSMKEISSLLNGIGTILKPFRWIKGLFKKKKKETA